MQPISAIADNNLRSFEPGPPTDTAIHGYDKQTLTSAKSIRPVPVRDVRLMDEKFDSLAF